MMQRNLYYAAAAVVVLIVVLAAAYKMGWFDTFLPLTWRSHKSTFVGAYGRTPDMEGCLAYGGPLARWTHFNRCTYA